MCFRLAGNPFAGLVQNDGSQPNPQQGVENREPLPNPWAASPANSATSVGNNIGGGTPGGGNNNPAAAPGLGGLGGLGGGGGTSNIMQQMMQNMGGMQNLLNTPYTQNLLESLVGNPDLAQQLMGANPLFANNPQMQVRF